jgi:hypothetical protein
MVFPLAYALGYELLLRRLRAMPQQGADEENGGV